MFLMGKSTINGHVQWQTVSLPEGMEYWWNDLWNTYDILSNI